MSKKTQKKKYAYKAAMLLKYWKANKEPLMDLCMIIAMYAQDIDKGLLYTAGSRVMNWWFGNITLSRITLQNKDGNEVLVKDVMNGNVWLRVFLLENGTVRMIKKNKSTFDITLEPEIISINSGNYCNSLFVIDTKMCAYEIKDETPVRVTGLPNGIKIKDISCGNEFTVFLSECGRVLGTGLNNKSALGLPHRIKKIEIPTEITFLNQSNLDKKGIMITMIYASMNGWVAVDCKQRAWVVGGYLMQSVHSDYELLDPCIGIVEVWYFNNIRIVQIKCGVQHVITLDTEGRVYWFGRFNHSVPLSHASLDTISFSHRITDIRSGNQSVACKDATNEWYVWGKNLYNHITGLCGCEAVCKKTKNNGVISNPMRCKWQGLFDATSVINLQLGHNKAHVIVDSV